MATVKKRVVLKFGTGILTGRHGGLDRAQIRRLAEEIAAAMGEGWHCIVVSSGAIGAGAGALGLKARPEDLAAKQACAAIGQTLLMQAYQLAFARHRLKVAQMLLTHADLDSRTRAANARNTLEHLLGCGGIVPVINENDVVAVEEIRELRIGDNDELSVDVALLARAALLVLLTSVDGVMRPGSSGPEVVPELREVSCGLKLVTDEKGRLSVGGMATKLRAAERAAAGGIRTVIANGRRPGLLAALLAGHSAGTAIPAHRAKR